VRATNVFYYLTYEGAVDLESTQEIPPSFTEPETTFAKVKPKTTFDDEIDKAYSRCLEDFIGPEATFCRFFPDEAEYFPNSLEVFKKFYASVGDP
jgi:hypothetical protein